MIEIPDDPLDMWITRTRALGHKIAFQFLNETEIIAVGMNQPNEIVTTHLRFEVLDSEKLWSAGQLSHLKECIYRQYPQIRRQLTRKLARSTGKRLAV